MSTAEIDQLTVIDGGDLITLSGDSQNRLFHVTPNGTLTLQRLILIWGVSFLS